MSAFRHLMLIAAATLALTTSAFAGSAAVAFAVLPTVLDEVAEAPPAKATARTASEPDATPAMMQVDGDEHAEIAIATMVGPRDRTTK